MDKDDKKTTPSEVKETALTEKKSGESPQMAVLSERLDLPSIVKPITPHVGANTNLNLSNRYMSVTGTFGIGAFVCMAWTGYCFVTKRPWGRPLLVTAAFGATYGVLDYKDNKLNAKAAKKEASAENKNDTPASNTPKNGTPKPFELKTISQLDNETSCNPDEWFVEGYVAIGLVNWILAKAGVGKSIFMVQIAVAVSSGTRIEFLPQDNHTPRKTQVVFYRIEVFANEYEKKYGKDKKVLEEAGVNFRDRKDLSATNYQGLLDDLKLMVETISEDTLVCIDPATKLRDFDAGKFAEDAEILMDRAKEEGFCLTFLCSAHLDEIEEWKPVSTADIRGGDRLIQTAGSVFAIQKERTGDKYRFFNILKMSKGFDGDNSQVLVCKIVPGNKFPHGEYVGHKSEAEALPLKPKAESDNSGKKAGVEPEASPKTRIDWTDEMKEKLKELHQAGTNDHQIAKKLNELFGSQFPPQKILHDTQIDRKLKKMGLRPPEQGGKKKK